MGKKPVLFLMQDKWFGNYIKFIKRFSQKSSIIGNQNSTRFCSFYENLLGYGMCVVYPYLELCCSVFLCFLTQEILWCIYHILIVSSSGETYSFVLPEYQEHVRYFHKCLTSCIICVSTGTCCFSSAQLQWELHSGNLNTLLGWHREQIACSSTGILTIN